MAVVGFRVKIGGDYFAEHTGIDLTYTGSGQHTADRVNRNYGTAVITVDSRGCVVSCRE